MRRVLSLALVVLLLMRACRATPWRWARHRCSHAADGADGARHGRRRAHHAAAMAQDCCDHQRQPYGAPGRLQRLRRLPFNWLFPLDGGTGTGAQHNPQAPPGTRFTSALAAQAIKATIF